MMEPAQDFWNTDTSTAHHGHCFCQISTGGLRMCHFCHEVIPETIKIIPTKITLTEEVLPLLAEYWRQDDGLVL